MNVYTGKEVLKGSKWYPVTIEADTIQEANKRVNKKTTNSKLRGRFHRANKY